eukprot:gene9426-6754_t
MFDTSNDNDKKFPQFPSQPSMQRSVSAPAIAEHVSEAILPSFNLEGEDSVGLHVSSYSYSSNPNRLNPRLPGAKRSDHEENELKSLLDESAAGWNAIMGDSSLIQSDFPSAPSSLYLGDTGAVPEPPRLSPMVNAPMPALISNAAIGDDSLDQAAKSMSKLYTVDTTGGSFVGQSNMGINTANTTGFLSVDASAFAYNPQGAPLGMLGGGKMGGNAGGANTAGAITQGGYQIIPPQTGNTAVYPPQMGAQMPQLMMQQAPMSVGPAMQGGANPQQSQGFFMQPQQLFMNNNGQPMFFRTGK